MIEQPETVEEAAAEETPAETPATEENKEEEKTEDNEEKPKKGSVTHMHFFISCRDALLVSLNNCSVHIISLVDSSAHSNRDLHSVHTYRELSLLELKT